MSRSVCAAGLTAGALVVGVVGIAGATQSTDTAATESIGVTVGLLAGASAVSGGGLESPSRGDAAVTASADVLRPLPKRWSGGPVTVLPTRKRVVALTIDCGSSDEGLDRILTTLRRKSVTATFFVTGQFARRYPDQVRAIAADGHRIGNHSFTHPHFTSLSAQGQARQLRRTEAAVTPLAGASTRPWFRFPYGDYDRSAVDLVNSRGYAAIGWTVDSLGWQGTSGGQSVRSVRNRVVAAARPGEIALMHAGANPEDGSTLDARALRGIITDLADRGYGFVPLRIGMKK